MRETTGSFDFVKILTSKKDKESVEDKKVRYELEAEFIALTMPKYIGRRQCEKWCADNKGKSFLQHLTNSDRAYFKLLLEDRGDVYEEEYEMVDKLGGRDIELYKQFKRNAKSVAPEDRTR